MEEIYRGRELGGDRWRRYIGGDRWRRGIGEIEMEERARGDRDGGEM